ncbi:small ribosomal subunit protein uS11m-like isoform X1 [Lytechinus pictus]|uniref:small ribosomal subunit protein uS11m-like isoform X1 n=1 Tax=Lytechinus pictus TaxID=7653 RepID=UPI0030B9F483
MGNSDFMDSGLWMWHGLVLGESHVHGPGGGSMHGPNIQYIKTFIAPSDTNSLIFNGTLYDQLPIVNIKATYNNTHISVADHTGRTVARTSCGTEGFKNAKKGTAIAAQTAAIAAATKALDKGMNTVRIVIKGIGPGRQTSIKGLQMGGLDIVSITDNTPVPHNGCRPRKARRL